MRAGPLADPKLIELLNRYFVPVYVANEDYGKDGAASPDEKKEYQRIYLEALNEKRSAGSVCVYLLAPDGKGIASETVGTVTQGQRLQKMLHAAVAQLKTAPGKPLVPPTAQSVRPPAADDALVLHLVSRVDHRYSWGEFPSENWIVLPRGDWAKLVPPDGARAGTSWDIDKAVAARLLTYFYPQTETCHCALDTAENGPHKHRIERQSLKATIISTDNGLIRTRLQGSVRLKHTFYPDRDDNNVANATVLGYVDFDESGKKVQSLRLVTDQATYGQHKFSVALRSVR
ncbi:MAG TPA: hypothetical protein VKI65_11700 [Gemmataceae bacterium]|nr:hypothetical protein [Gemmataceae bacterium]